MSSYELRAACSAGHLDIAQRLHSGGASVDAVDNEGRASLYHACRHGHLDVAQWLHSVGATVNATGNAGYAPLHLACSRGHLDLAQWLHSAGASLDATATSNGWAPLHIACFNGYLDITQWLCSVGANATLKTNDGRTPAQLLQQRARTVQFDQQALRSTLACLVRRAQAQGPLPCTTLPRGRRSS